MPRPGPSPSCTTLQAEESKARAVAAAARKERAAAREKAAVARAARHAPSAVIMTDQHRRAVADLLADLSVRDGEGGRLGIDAGPVPEGSSVASEARRLGFSEAAVATAMQVLGPAVSLMQALDWLCLNIPEEELPTRFAPGGELLESVGMCGKGLEMGFLVAGRCVCV